MINIMKRVRIHVFGRVQKVFFRDSTRRKARKLNLTGWVKNEQNGSVTIFAEGEEENIKKLIAWSQKGPLLAKVTNVEIQWEGGEKQFNNFDIIH